MENSIKTSNLTKAAVIICIMFVLVIPFKIIQSICICILCVILFSYIQSRILLKKIDAEHTFKNLKLACHEQTEIIFHLKNNSFLPCFFCYFFDDVPYLMVAKDKNSGVCVIRPKEILRIEYRITALERGRFYAGPLKLKMTDILGLFQISKTVSDKTTVTVRPARIKFQTLFQPGTPQGNEKILNPIYEDISLHKNIRPYESHDSIRRINWRATAKYQSLFTNQYELRYDVPVFVFLNLAEDDYPLKEMRWYTEKAIEIAANIIQTAGRHKLSVGFAAYSQDFPYLSPKQNQSDFILDILSEIKTVSGKTAYTPKLYFTPKLPHGTLFYQVGPEEVESYFAKLTAGKDVFSTKNLGILKNGK